jgi:menaquinone-dependent protoporphyrinogen IX oxidase
MQGIIIYKGKYGATKQYANWLGEALALSVRTPETFTARQFAESDFVVIGSSVYIGAIQLKGWLQENANLLKTKKLFLFIVCATPAAEKEKIETIIKSNVPDSLRQQCDIYILRGRVIRHQLSWKDRLLLKIGSMAAKGPAQKEKMTTDFDGVKQENINVLVNAVKKLYPGANTIKHAGRELPLQA